MNDKKEYLNLIEKEIVNYEVTKQVKNYSINKSDLLSKYNIGKILAEANNYYGAGIIKEYSIYLTKKYGKGYKLTNLKYFRQFYLYIENGHSLSDQLTITHYRALLSIKDINESNYYIWITIKENLSVSNLRKRIKSNEYERLDEDTRNKLISNNESNELTVTSLVKNPILIKNTSNNKDINEKILQGLILEDISSFMKELGEGFCFIDNEYKIRVGNNFNYIDLLLFNIKYNCYVVIELKVTELKKEHIGQIMLYKNYIDNTLKTINQDNTIGIIICKEDNEYIIAYSSDSRVISRTYELI